MFAKKTYWLILVLILFSAAFIRFYRLVDLPPALNWDEVSHAYNAYSLLKTGRDQWGVPFPVLNYRAYGDYPAVLDTYLTVVPIFLFGPTDYSVRMVPALVGVLTCLLGFLAGFYYFKKPAPALLLCLFIAFEPWTFFPSRAVFQSNLAVLLLTLGLALYFAKRPFWAVVIWGLSLFAYHNTRIFIPLFLIFLLPKFIKNTRVFLASLSVIIFGLGILILPQTRARSSWVGILDSGAIAYLEQLRNHSPLPLLLTRLLVNRPVYFMTTAVRHYFQYFSPAFLFISGGTQYQYSIPGFGVMNWADLPFFYFGLYLLFKKRKYFLLSWILLSPLPAAVTRDEFAVIRSTAMLPVVFLITVYGFWYFWKRLQQKFHLVLGGLFIGVYCLFVWFYFSDFLSNYPVKYSASWQYGYQQLTSYLNTISNRYDRIIVTKRYGEPHEYFLWYLRIDPRYYQTTASLAWNFHDDWFWVDAFSKFRFVNDWELPDIVSKRDPGIHAIVVTSPDHQIKNGGLLYRINFLDRSPALFVKQI